MRTRFISILKLFSIVVVVVAARAQGPTAVVVGTVTDSSGGVISGATVRARHVETQLEQIATTNPAGAYRLVGLQAGTHELTVSAPQFSTQRQTGILLHVG